MKVYYIYHSCFVVETETSFLIFDYFDDKRTPKDDFNFKEVLNDIFKSNKHLYVFSSHSHHDHFNRSILSWSSQKKEIYYILSNDIKLYAEVKNIYTVGKDETTEINNLKISTFGSTDEGVSFLVEIDGHTIFHAGDLNWWKWSDDTPEEEKEMETAFKSIIKDILIKDVAIDIAFFPVDGRLKENYFCGGQYFIELIKPRIFVPMHFWDNFNITSLFKKSQDPTTTNIIELQHNNQIIIE